MLGIKSDNSNNININDPVSDEFYNYFRELARKNTLIYEEIFATLPSDRVRKFDQISQYTEVPKLKDTNPLEVEDDTFLFNLFLKSFSFFLRHKKN